MADRSDMQTPSAQQQHQPPSLPTSPHPKRVKTDDLVNPTTTQMTLPTMPTPSTTLPAPDLSSLTPTPTPTAGAGNGSLLPPVSSLLPSMNTAPLQNGPPLGLSTSFSDPLPPPLLIQKLSEDATTPTRGSAFAAGYDLYASAPITLSAKSKGLVSTSIAISVPAGTYGRVAPRSGLASKHFLDTGAGVIDADYRGEVKVLMFNFSDVDYEVKKGERIAQLIIERIFTPEVVVVDKLEESVRGAGGFGSTGTI